MDPADMVNRPLAAAGLTSYRYPSAYGWVMIGARDATEALREAARSVQRPVDPARLEVWTGQRYEHVR